MICFETIKVKDGKLLNLEYHQKRMDYTREFFGFKDKLELNKQGFDLPQKGEFRLRVDYGKEIKALHVQSLEVENLESLKS